MAPPDCVSVRLYCSVSSSLEQTSKFWKMYNKAQQFLLYGGGAV